MTELKVSCPNCDQHIVCDESHRGVQFPCPTCGTAIIIPAASLASAPIGRIIEGKAAVMSAPQLTRPHIPPSPHVSTGPRGKSWLNTFLLAWFLGFLGIDRFYNGRTGLGIGKLLTFGGFLVWSLIDCLLLLFGKYQDARGNYLQPARGSHRIIALSIVGLVLVGNLLTAGLLIHTLKSGLATLESAAGNAQVGDPQDGFASPEAVFEAMKEDPDSVILHPPEERRRLAYESMAMIRLAIAFLDDPEQVRLAEEAIQKLLRKHDLTDRLEFSNAEDEEKITALVNAAFADVDIKVFMDDLTATLASSDSTKDPDMTRAEGEDPKLVSMENLSINGDEATATMISSDGSEEPAVFVKSGNAWFHSFLKSRERLVAQHQSGGDDLMVTHEVELIIIFEDEASRNKATARELLKDAIYDRTSPCKLENNEGTNSATLSFSTPISTKIRSIRSAIMQQPGVTQVLSGDPYDPDGLVATKLLITFDSAESHRSATAERLLQGVDYDRRLPATLGWPSWSDEPNQSQLKFTEFGSSDLDTIINKIRQVPGVKEVADEDAKFDELMKANLNKAWGQMEE